MKWITIEEYAQHYKVSLSSLREKIETGQIEYQLSSAKYFIKDQALPEKNPFDKETLDSPIMNLEEKNKELIESLNKKNQELIKLRGEYEDLKNLVQWLEQDNKEMRHILNSLHRIDKWMKDPEAPAN
ncbi:MAG: hypothetical protein OXK80_01260 [Bdellovibrionales bacterium]|nr:hypothetical protein [Bdellovibrionales bacterium]